MPRIAHFVAMGAAAAALACQEHPTSPPYSAPPVLPPEDVAIAFVSDRDGSPHIYLADSTGTVVVRLVSGSAPAFSRDGHRIAFDRGLTGSGIYVVNLDGSGERRLASGRNPAWSPDDRQIVFDGDDGIYVVAVDGSGTPQLLLRDDAAPRPDWQDPWSFDPGWVEQPSWSPDGEHIAFVRADPIGLDWGVELNVYVMNADGTEPRLLGGQCPIQPPGQGVVPCPTNEPAWSVDGTYVTLATYAHNGTTGLMDPVVASVGPDGWESRTVHYRGYKNYVAAPYWMPHGDRILFAQHASSSFADKRLARIFVLSVGTGAVQRLVPDALSPARRDYVDSDPVWSPASSEPWDY
ncbi:MAG TPA: hypothetical protein VFZ69_04650 [Longimicrobiales bacterium]